MNVSMMEPNSFYGKAKNSSATQGHQRPSLAIQPVNNAQATQPSPKLVHPNDFRRQLRGPTKVWRLFPKQADAIKFAEKLTRRSAKTLSEHFVVVALENESVCTAYTGQRHFLVSSLDQFAFVYLDVPSNKRFAYEVICDGHACKLYLDIEFDKTVAENTLLDGPYITKQLIVRLIGELKHCYPGHNFDAEKVLELDSTTSSKFSRHIIFPNVIFADNIQAGYFIQYVMLKIQQEHSVANTTVDTQHKQKAEFSIFACKKSNLHVTEKTPVVDTGVYTKNRNFRCYLSCKVNKFSPLVLAKDAENYSFYAKSGERHILDTSMICYVLPALKNHYGNDCSQFLQFTHDTLNKADIKLGMELGISNSTTNSQLRRLLRLLSNASQPSSKSVNSHRSEKSVCCHEGGTNGDSSPYHEIDRFILQLVNADPKHCGWIRQWQMFTSPLRIVYIIGGAYRYCEHISRHHKSNSIMLIANVDFGSYCQRCFDPECRAIDFRSVERPLPAEVLPSFIFRDVFEDDQPHVKSCSSDSGETKPEILLTPTTNSLSCATTCCTQNEDGVDTDELNDLLLSIDEAAVLQNLESQSSSSGRKL